MTNAQRFNTTKEAFDYFLKTPPVNPATFVDWMDSPWLPEWVKPEAWLPEWVKPEAWVQDIRVKKLYRIKSIDKNVLCFTNGACVGFGSYIVQINVRPWNIEKVSEQILTKNKFLFGRLERSISGLHLYNDGSFNIRWAETAALTSPEWLAENFETANHQPCGYVEFP